MHVHDTSVAPYLRYTCILYILCVCSFMYAVYICIMYVRMYIHTLGHIQDVQ